ncbi:MAG: S8 family serine peptidase [candidate division Zixibacteria bacterium]|jgi:PKD repeat protein|nr:S8 family serine peptidase [candidate division Zixibacteria bacterium]
MSTRFRFIMRSLTLACAVAVCSAGAAELPALQPQPVVIEKAAQPVSAESRQYLTTLGLERVKVWVFFTDKGVADQAQFATAARSVYVSEKVMQRRSKVGLDRVLFADLPVVKTYVDQVEATGAAVRRVSKYLNAASFEVSLSDLDRIAALPFVARIQPMATFVRTEPDVEKSVDGGMSPESTDDLTPGADLNYGSSFDQLNQINVIPVHEKGYNGEGVTLAIFDTGYRKTHQAFAQHYAEGRVLGEWDFVFEDGNTANEAADWSSQWNHGTYIWSTSAGYLDGAIYGPAYKASFLLAKTEDVRSETQVEEDNWVAAVEWADSAGADVITSSLGYSDWYTYADFDGETAAITIAANTAHDLGILVCTSMGNSGPATGTLTAPADAFASISVGAVSSSGSIASFSSRGPSFDGRTKPEVVARGVSTYCASSSSDASYTAVNGTSLSTPLVAGAAVVLVQARPTFTPDMIRTALMETADRANNPDNSYGWGLVNLDAALSWGANFYADVTVGDVPLTVQFFDSSTLTVSSWLWDFGDGHQSTDENPAHEFVDPGAYTVTLTVQTAEYGELITQKLSYVVALGDTLTISNAETYAGQQAVVSVNLTNALEVESLTFPFRMLDTPINVTFDSVSRGSRTEYFEQLTYLTYNPTANLFTVRLQADDGGGALPLPPGEGEVLKIFVRTDPLALGGLQNLIDTMSTTSYSVSVKSPMVEYVPRVNPGSVGTTWVMRGDANNSATLDLSDLIYLVNHLYLGGPGTLTVQHGDANADLQSDLSDLIYLANFLFLGGPAPQTP